MIINRDNLIRYNIANEKTSNTSDYRFFLKRSNKAGLGKTSRGTAGNGGIVSSNCLFVGFRPLVMFRLSCKSRCEFRWWLASAAGGHAPGTMAVSHDCLVFQLERYQGIHG